MAALLGAALVVMIALVAMTAYVRRRPPDMSERGLRHFRKGLSLACLSSILLAGAYSLCFVAMPTSPRPNPLLVLLAGGGNLLNAASLIYGLRELSGESLFAGLLMVSGQLLWLWFGIFVMVAGDF